MFLGESYRASRGCATYSAIFAYLFCAGCFTEPPPEEVLQTRLFKHVESSQPLELASGAHVEDGEELFLILQTGKPLNVYVLAENIALERSVIYPCSKWSHRKRFQPGRAYRLPPQIFGVHTFWPVQGATERERLIVVASTKTLDDLEASLMTADASRPCATSLTEGAQAWVNRVAANIRRRSRDARSHTLRVLVGQDEIWVSMYDLKGRVHRVWHS